MLYTCDACQYIFPAEEYHLFRDRGTVDRCPDCGKKTVRPATEAEIVSYERIKKEIEEEDKKEIPNQCSNETK